MKTRVNVGFDGRVFLEEFEWRTYLRRMPVRYIRKQHADVCSICGQPGTQESPLEHSHRIGFRAGVVTLGLTPEFLDGHFNIVSAHRGRCNAAAELDYEGVIELLRSMGHANLPDYINPTNQTRKEPPAPD